MAQVYKGGRKKKPGHRHDCGKLIQSRDDRGTPEQRLKRELAAGSRTEAEGGLVRAALTKLHAANLSLSNIGAAAVVRAIIENGILTEVEVKRLRAFQAAPHIATGTDPLDILLARKIIDRDQFESALDFTRCWCVNFGRPWPKGWQAERQSPDFGGGMSEAQLKRMRIRYSNCLAAMNQVSVLIYPLVSDIVIHGKMAGAVVDILGFDIVRQDGYLLARKFDRVPPSLRARIANICRGLDIISETPFGDYSREAMEMLEQLRRRDGEPKVC